MGADWGSRALQRQPQAATLGKCLAAPLWAMQSASGPSHGSDGGRPGEQPPAARPLAPGAGLGPPGNAGPALATTHGEDADNSEQRAILVWRTPSLPVWQPTPTAMRPSRPWWASVRVDLQAEGLRNGLRCVLPAAAVPATCLRRLRRVWPALPPLRFAWAGIQWREGEPLWEYAARRMASGERADGWMMLRMTTETGAVSIFAAGAWPRRRTAARTSDSAAAPREAAAQPSGSDASPWTHPG